MDKIKDLLVKAGCTGDLVDAICESLDQYKTTLRGQYEAEYTTKVEAAKKVCVEETESHKRELARRLQIFCETKGVTIEAQLARQSALNESEALAKLYALRNVLEGLPNSEQNGNVQAAMGKAKQQIKLATEERDRATQKANRAIAMAEKVLKNNRELTTRLNKLTESKTPVAESRQPRGTKRIDGQRARRPQQPVSTRPTILENQDRRRPQATPANQANSGYGIAEIASEMDDDA